MTTRKKTKTQIKLVLVLTLEGDAGDAYGVVNDVLDNGTFQDAIAEYAGDNDHDVSVRSAVLVSGGAAVLDNVRALLRDEEPTREADISLKDEGTFFKWRTLSEKGRAWTLKELESLVKPGEFINIGAKRVGKIIAAAEADGLLVVQS